MNYRSIYIVLLAGGNDNPLIDEQIIAITNKLLEYESITTNQQQNIVSAFK